MAEANVQIVIWLHVLLEMVPGSRVGANHMQVTASNTIFIFTL